MSKGQRAMALAMNYPEAGQAQAKTLELSSKFRPATSTKLRVMRPNRRPKLLAGVSQDSRSSAQHGEDALKILTSTHRPSAGTQPPSRLRDEEGIYTYRPPRRARAPAKYLDLETAREQYLRLVQDFGLERRLREAGPCSGRCA